MVAEDYQVAVYPVSAAQLELRGSALALWLEAGDSARRSGVRALGIAALPAGSAPAHTQPGGGRGGGGVWSRRWQGWAGRCLEEAAVRQDVCLVPTESLARPPTSCLVHVLSTLWRLRASAPATRRPRCPPACVGAHLSSCADSQGASGPSSDAAHGGRRFLPPGGARAPARRSSLVR